MRHVSTYTFLCPLVQRFGIILFTQSELGENRTLIDKLWHCFVVVYKRFNRFGETSFGGGLVIIITSKSFGLGLRRVVGRDGGLAVYLLSSFCRRFLGAAEVKVVASRQLERGRFLPPCTS